MKRYFAADARQALREVREEQGPDAVILSNRRVAGGVEIIAAIDYEDALVNASLGNPAGNPTALTDSEVSSAHQSAPAPERAFDIEPESGSLAPNAESSANKPVLDPALGRIQDELKGLRDIMEAPMMQFAWGEVGRVKPLYASLLKQLMMLGISPPLCESISSKIANKGLHKHNWLEALKLLSSMVPVADDDLLEQGGVVSLVGPTGVGKTTTIAKLAARFALRHGRRNVALVTTDSYRIGAHEQLRTYGRILGVPVQVASDRDELKNVLEHNGQHKLTLIDTAGVSHRDMRLSEQLATLKVGGLPIKNYLVLSATGQRNLQDDVIRAFAQAGLQGCILTKIDEAASLGEILSVLILHKLPIAFVSDGQKVPDNLHTARGKLLVREAVKLMQKTRKAPSEEELAYTFGGMVNNAYI
ncbi:MAG: flagellar biosynthesis protein FlhF [Gammaproteobacteria bacterium]